jgi:hypothetical protein
VLKGVVTVEDWKTMSQQIKFDFAKDNYYEELKETDVLNSRLQVASQLTPNIGKYYSHGWIRSNIFKHLKAFFGCSSMLRSPK